MYVTGYQGQTKTLAELAEWSHWKQADIEFRRRVLAILDASIAAGRPLGVGSIFRSSAAQEALFLSRYEPHPLGSAVWAGKRWRLKKGMSPAAPPGRSYHEATTPLSMALAVDFTGDLKFLAEHAAEYGLVEFSAVNGEPWHGQPVEIPNSRRRYIASVNHPLPEFPLPAAEPVAPVKPSIPAPLPVLRVSTRKTQPKDQVRALQHLCNFWQWRDALGRDLIVDGDYGDKTDQSVRSMQAALKVTVDGVYGVESQWALQAFLDVMAGFA